LIKLLAIANRSTTVSMSAAKWPGIAAVWPVLAPAAANVNSLIRLSTCDLASSSRSVGTSPSDTG